MIIRFRLASLILTVLGALATSSFGAEDWHWIKGSNVLGEWHVTRGRADVQNKAGRIKILLFEDDFNHVSETLTGAFKTNGELTVQEKIMESDFTGSQYRGHLLTKRWRQSINAIFGTESITLSDGFNIIGITRALHK